MYLSLVNRVTELEKQIQKAPLGLELECCICVNQVRDRNLGEKNLNIHFPSPL